MDECTKGIEGPKSIATPFTNNYKNSGPSFVDETDQKSRFDFLMEKCTKSIGSPQNRTSPLTNNYKSSGPSFPEETLEKSISDFSMDKHSKGIEDPQNLTSPVTNIYKSSGPSFAEETPVSEISRFNFSMAKCTKGNEGPQNLMCSVMNNYKSSGTDQLICVDSDSDSDSGSKLGSQKCNDRVGFTVEVEGGAELSSQIIRSTCFRGSTDASQVSDINSQPTAFQNDILLDYQGPCEKTDRLESFEKVTKPNSKIRDNLGRKSKVDEDRERKRALKEEKLRLKEEKKLKKELEKKQKAAQKVEAVEMKKAQKEMQKWEKGKHALKSIVALIDTRVVELGPIGGHLITRLAEKGISYRITSNPIEKSILWTMSIPEKLSEISFEPVDIRYVLLLYEAEEFCNLVLNGSLLNHVSNARSLFPLHKLCCLTNRLTAYVNKREQSHYKDPTNNAGWKRPPIEEVLAKLTTQFVDVHSRQCADEAEVADHVVCLTCNLASCQFRKKLSRLSIKANGSLIPKDCVDKDLIKNSTWLKALLAIPKVQPRFAITIGKKYPTMKSLLSVYMDPNKSVHEKEFLLSDLRIDGLFGDNRRLGEVCSKRVYRILMAQSGGIKTDDIESGADFFATPVGSASLSLKSSKVAYSDICV
ncbi:unnamed protein product [Cuscuta epithymum]|uniref:ERCC4 domain-containing protein n=1 Tax=Cuscuta epithymum TaxID=186058 RepID=A0AAV0FUY5_9ASTE|nr:unnamed protein product [Cuscuta epithymum]CAH9139438.1 unnamed protein product [Cuscuta epithymum]